MSQNKEEGRPKQLKRAARGFGRMWRDFVTTYAENPDLLYCFFEGKEDPTYYGSRIDWVVFSGQSPQRKNLWCEGKENVLAAFELVKQKNKYVDAWVAFFIDRDFDSADELPNSPELYITPCYSIENLYLDISTISKILENEFLLSDSDNEFLSTCNLFEERLREFNNASTDLNAWIYLQRKSEKLRENSSRMNLDKVTYKKLFSLKLTEGIVKNYDLDSLNSDPNCPSIDEEDLKSQIKIFNQLDSTQTYRGKYLISFLLDFLKKLVEDSNKSAKTRDDKCHFSERRPVSMLISENIISELSQYAFTPPCLMEFLSNIRSKRPQEIRLDM